MVASTLDPDGRRVFLTVERWEHIRSGHAALAPKLREVMAAVREPSHTTRGSSANEMWFFAEDTDRLRWLQVVVHYEGGEGWTVTAFPREALPR